MTMYPARNGLYSQRPAAGNAGKIWTPTDGPLQYYDNGTKWVPMIPGAGMPGSEVAPGNVNPFTLVTAGSGIGASLIVQGGMVTFKCTSTGGSTQVVQLAEVARTGNTGPQMWMRSRSTVVAFRGVYVRNASSGQILLFGTDFNGGITNGTGQEFAVIHYTNQTTFSATVLADQPNWIAEPLGLRLRNDGTNYNAEYCIDGTNWLTIYSESNTAFVPSAGDHCGVALNPFSALAEINILAFDVK